MNDDLLARLNAYAKLLPTEPIPRLLKVGTFADAAIRAVVPKAETQAFASPLDRYLGIDIVTDPELEPDQWKLEDSWGNVLKEGRFDLTGPAL